MTLIRAGSSSNGMTGSMAIKMICNDCLCKPVYFCPCKPKAACECGLKVWC